MLVKEENRRDIEEKLKTLGDYVKIDYLASCLKKNLDFDSRKFVLVTLSNLYEKKGMLSDAARLMSFAAEINSTYQGKIDEFLKSADIFIKGGNFNEAEIAFGKAIACANEAQKISIKAKRKEMFKAQAKAYLKLDKRKHAMDAFEKLLTFDLTQEEKREAQSTLLDLYEKLGKVREFYSLKNSM